MKLAVLSPRGDHNEVETANSQLEWETIAVVDYLGDRLRLDL